MAGAFIAAIVLYFEKMPAGCHAKDPPNYYCPGRTFSSLFRQLGDTRIIHIFGQGGAPRVLPIDMPAILGFAVASGAVVGFVYHLIRIDH
jgi:hypothetical protein